MSFLCHYLSLFVIICHHVGDDCIHISIQLVYIFVNFCQFITINCIQICLQNHFCHRFLFTILFTVIVFCDFVIAFCIQICLQKASCIQICIQFCHFLGFVIVKIKPKMTKKLQKAPKIMTERQKPMTATKMVMTKFPYYAIKIGFVSILGVLGRFYVFT